MNTEQLEKQLSVWNRFMYMALGSSITLLIISFGNFFYGNRWSHFENYAGGLWQWMQIATTPPGFYLLWSKHWKVMQFSNRKNTIVGFFIASWLTFLSLGFITANDTLIDFTSFVIVGAVLLALGYIWMAKKKSKQSDEMFP